MKKSKIRKTLEYKVLVQPMHHKNCGGELFIKQWRNYNFGEGENYGTLPDYYCRKCGDFITGDAQIQETIDEIQFR
jgi:hypothetical protein